ncbi:tripartite tricarboxylate transporter substrate binding protein [Hydrogenophaga sp.]|uniref:Bug family tripartite tricarboxylate transporter substrate binding protein n=1 Tax=Hydrogenophaga sp. TaxID=1904254 RepID=UPI00271B3574|nr:tripartite tricarboxylate transporter substrate binding protein [Hydrogenophaga sp.]MDO9436999.1 tripartite tricarboxylate transporter substrate binding protein [Hydrogenophaga sp.]
MQPQKSSSLRRRSLCLVALGLPWTAAFAQAFPSKPLTYVVGYGAGAGIDAVARIVAQRVGEGLGQPVVVENRVGAAGSIALDYLYRSAPDGYTILIAGASELIYQYASRNARRDLLSDYTPVSLTGALPLVLAVSETLPVKSVDELVALAKSKPGKLNYATVVGATPHFMSEAFNRSRGLDMTMVPYKSSHDAALDVATGRVEVMFTTVVAAVPLAKSGKIRVLGVTGKERSSLLPDVPTMAEIGLPQIDVGIGYYVLAPKGTPKEVISTLSAQWGRVMKMKDVQEKLAGLGIEPKSSTPEELEVALKSEAARWRRLVKDVGVQVD